jgi:signal peptidase I
MKNWMRANKGFVLFLMLFGIFRTACADWNPIPSGSMRPNLLEGDVVFVNRLAFDLKLPLTDKIIARLGEPKSGDVVTFSSPVDGTRLIKRILAVPGDTIQMRDEHLIVNGVAADYQVLGQGIEPLADGATTPSVQLRETVATRQRTIQLLPRRETVRDFDPVTIPEGQYLMLGDNRDNSADSRFIGLVPRHLLIGRAERVLVSADIMGNWMPRFGRFGQSLY